jgi:quaternary ammonium compound-resistance protein SugE
VPWIVLIVAGLLEVAWASVLPSTHGLTRPVPTVAFVVLLAGSMLALARAADSIPIGTAYGVWVGIGAVGTALVGVAFHGDPATPARLGFLMLLVIAIVGLESTSGH